MNNDDFMFDILETLPATPAASPKQFTTLPVIRGKDILSPLYCRFNEQAKFAGGFVRWMVSPTINPVPYGDIDIFPHSAEDYKQINATLTKSGLESIHKSSVAITYGSVKFGPLADLPKIQVINPQNQGKLIAKGTMEEILSAFDFTVTRAALISLDTAMVDIDFVQDETNKRLVIKNIHCPIGSSLRFMKYTKKGYRANATEVLKLFNDWDSRPADYIKALKDGIPKLAIRNDEDELSSDEREALAKLIYID